MAKDKDTSGECGPTSRPSANQSLRDLSIIKVSASESSHDIDVIMKESRKVDIIKIETVKKLLENIKRQHKLTKIMANLTKEEE